MDAQAVRPGTVLLVAGMAMWALSSVLPAPLNLAAGAPALPFMAGPIVQWRKKKQENTLTVKWGPYDWLGLTIFLLAFAAVAQGYDPITIIKILSRQS